MSKSLTVLLLISVLGLIVPGQGKTGHKPGGANYQIAFASFAPLNMDIFMDIFVADADGRNAKPLLPHPDQDY